MQVLVLENVRFYKEETKNDPGFAEKVCRYRSFWSLATAIQSFLCHVIPYMPGEVLIRTCFEMWSGQQKQIYAAWEER